MPAAHRSHDTSNPVDALADESYDAELRRETHETFASTGKDVRGQAMPKEIKGNPRRKPPEPSTEHAGIDQWRGGLIPNLQPIVARLDESIRAAASGLHYGVKFNRAFYGAPGQGWIIELASYYVSVNVLFFGGADFESPPPLGTTGRTRYVKVTSVAEASRPELCEWVRQAAQTPGWN